MKKRTEPINPPSDAEQEGAAPQAPEPAMERAGVPTDPAFDAPAGDGVPAGVPEGATLGEAVSTETKEAPAADEAAALADKQAIDAAFSKAAPAPAPNFAEPGTEQTEILPEESEYEGHFAIPLNDHTKAECADEFLELQTAKDLVEKEKSDANKSFKTRMDSIDEQMQNLALRIREGKSEVKCICVKRVDRVKNEVTIFRKDNWEILEQRPLDLKERQVTMHLPAPSKDNVKAGPWSFPRFAVATVSTSQDGAMIAEALKKVDGVDAVTVFENNSDEKDADGRPPHAMEIFVDGGKELEVGRAILAAKPGITSIGARSIVVKGIEIKFSRPRDGWPGQPPAPAEEPVMASALAEGEAAAPSAEGDVAPAQATEGAAEAPPATAASDELWPLPDTEANPPQQAEPAPAAAAETEA